MTQKKEIWKDVPNYEGLYEVSNMGRVRSFDKCVVATNGARRFYKGKIVEGYYKDGYRCLALAKNKRYKKVKHSQVVAMAFLNHKPNGCTVVVDHISGIRDDDRLENLRIVTHRENTSTCFRADKKKLTSQYAGVSWNKRDGKWYAKIQYKGVHISLGYYDVELDASMAYQTALSKIKDGTFNIEDYKPKFTSKYKGVTFQKSRGKWLAQITVKGERKHIGRFNTEIEAHHAYQKAI